MASEHEWQHHIPLSALRCHVGTPPACAGGESPQYTDRPPTFSRANLPSGSCMWSPWRLSQVLDLKSHQLPTNPEKAPEQLTWRG